MSHLEAVIFDHDGVLVDSEPIAHEIWCDILDEAGVRYDRAEVHGFVGLTDPDAHATMADRPGMPPLDQFLAMYESRRDARFTEELRPFPDAYQTVRVLAAEGVPLGVATNAPRSLLEMSLDLTGLGRYFQVKVARTDVPRGKPAPDVYLEAARLLATAPDRCLAIEDSMTGARAAAAAGMRVVTIARNGEAPGEFSSIRELDADLIMVWLGLR